MEMTKGVFESIFRLFGRSVADPNAHVSASFTDIFGSQGLGHSV